MLFADVYFHVLGRQQYNVDEHRMSCDVPPEFSIQARDGGGNHEGSCLS